MQNGSPFKVTFIDMDRIDEKKVDYCYTDKEARERYGAEEGKEFGDDVMICGHKLPKKRAMKFMKYCGKKVSHAFQSLSFEEKYSVMIGSLKFPEEFMMESMSEYWRGSKGLKCDACGVKPEGARICAVCMISVLLFVCTACMHSMLSFRAPLSCIYCS